MKRTVTVVAADTGAVADVRLDARKTLADVLPQLTALTGSTAASITHEGRALEPRLPVAHLHDGDVLLLTAAAEQRPAPAVRLDVTAGPDAGRFIELAPGRWVIGRGGQAVSLSDPLVSREHLEVIVDVDGTVHVGDLASANGTWLCDEPIPAHQPRRWPAGAVVRVGATWLVHGRHSAPAATAAAGDGSVIVNRPPRLGPVAASPTIVFPPAPAPATTGRLPLLASTAPLLAGVVLAMVMHRWEFLAFAVMSPLVVLGQALADRWSARRTNRRARAEHAAATAQAEAELTVALAAERQARHDRAPDLAALAHAAIDQTALIWHRGGGDGDALSLRLGLGDLPSGLCIDGAREQPVLADVPVCIDLLDTRVLGVSGDDAAALARSLVVQAATLLGPADLEVSVLAPGRAVRWAWARWLPHATLATTPAQARTLAVTRSPGDASRLRLVVVDGADVDLVDTLVGSEADSVICLANTPESLPAACAAVVTTAPGSATLRRVDADEVTFVADTIADVVAERVGRALCSLRDGRTAATALPRVIAWSQLHEVSLGTNDTAQSLLRRWRSGPTTTVCLGISADGPYVVDLSADGPHLLVAGTTGSGKSELLQSLVASLVAGNSPADLNLLLVDFKGGAAFGPCAALPHTVGVLTDLDPATTSRAIDSLTAELRRRERLLADAGAADLDSWRASVLLKGGGSEQLPRLVIVVDEYATLAEELPDFVSGLIGIAQRGRSLGVHLVLATQRPEGAVSADIRANTRLRICLAVAREAESRDVLDSPRALDISRTTPGRALVRTGAHELVEVQTARVAGPARTHTGRDDPLGGVELVPLDRWGQDDDHEPVTDAPTELDLLVAAADAAATLGGVRPASPPWLPPLPAHLALAELPAVTPDAVAVGLVDQPDRQRQPALAISVDDAEPWLIAGGGSSGRTCAVLTIATALAAALGPDEQHIYAIGHGRGLAGLTRLAHTGAVVDVRETDRVEQVLTFLTGEVDRRTTVAETGSPRLLLVVDGWDSLSATTSEVDGGRCQDLLLRLLTHGPAAGLRVVLTSDRSGLTGRLSATVRHRLCLRLPDAADYALLGLPARRVPTSMPPGRAIRAEDAALVQLAVADDDTVGRARSWPKPVHSPRKFEPLPTRVPLHALRPAAGRLIVGVGGDDGSAVLVDPDDAGGAFLVAGPPRSGRSTALVSIAAQLQARSPVALCARPGPLRQRRDLAVIADATDAVRSREVLHSLAPNGALLIDDVDLLDDPGVLDDIEVVMRRLRDGGGLVVLAGTTDAMVASFRGPVAQARRGRTGLLLRPDGAHDGELLGLRLRRRPGHSDPPGRGVLALHGRAVPVQVPDPN